MKSGKELIKEMNKPEIKRLVNGRAKYYKIKGS